MRKVLKFIAVAITLGAAFPATAAPRLETSDVGYTGPQLNLTGFNNNQYNFTFGPVSLPGGIIFTASPGGGGNTGQGSVIGQGPYGLGVNGSFGLPATYIGVDSSTGFAKLEFATAVSSFGGYWNYWQAFDSGGKYFFDGDTPTLSAFRADDTLIASYDLFTAAPINTPGAFNQFAFRGIVDDTADIKYLLFGGSYMVLAGTADGSLIAAPIPEPETYAMLLAGLGMLTLVARRRRKQA